MLILASQSPRRQELLRNAGVDFRVQAADIPELLQDGEHPASFAKRLAREKAEAVFEKLRTGELSAAAQPTSAEIGSCGAPSDESLSSRAGTSQQPLESENAKRETRNAKRETLFVLGADTVVVVDEHVLGKPVDDEDAARMLRLLSGRSHEVTTGVCLMGQDFVDVRSETTRVTFEVMTDDDIRAYVATGEPMDKAGAYGIQGVASRWIPRIEGDYFNVVGLPVALVWNMLRERGLSISDF